MRARKPRGLMDTIIVCILLLALAYAAYVTAFKSWPSDAPSVYCIGDKCVGRT